MTVSAPGKLMLMGEHAVVYGHPCIATAVNMRLNVSIEAAGNTIDIQAPHVTNTKFVDAAISLATKQWKLSYPGLRVRTQSTFSGRYGFGSSSAVTVGVITAMAGVFEKTPTHEEIFDLGLVVVRQVAGKGSGYDIASAVWGGTLWFVGGGKVVEDLPDFRECNLVVGYSGKKGDTRLLVEEVAKKRSADGKKVNRIFEGIEKLVVQGREAFIKGDWMRLGTYMNFNQEYLRDLGVSTEKLESLISAAKSAGAWGAKLSGAGGGDCMVAIASSDKKEGVRKAIQEASGETVDVEPHAEGVRVES